MNETDLSSLYTLGDLSGGNWQKDNSKHGSKHLISGSSQLGRDRTIKTEELESFDTEDFFPKFQHTRPPIAAVDQIADVPTEQQQQYEVFNDDGCGVRIHQNDSMDTAELLEDQGHQSSRKHRGQCLQILESIEVPKQEPVRRQAKTDTKSRYRNEAPSQDSLLRKLDLCFSQNEKSQLIIYISQILNNQQSMSRLKSGRKHSAQRSDLSSLEASSKKKERPCPKECCSKSNPAHRGEERQGTPSILNTNLTPIQEEKSSTIQPTPTKLVNNSNTEHQHAKTLRESKQRKIIPNDQAWTLVSPVKWIVIGIALILLVLTAFNQHQYSIQQVQYSNSLLSLIQDLKIEKESLQAKQQSALTEQEQCFKEAAALSSNLTVAHQERDHLVKMLDTCTLKADEMQNYLTELASYFVKEGIDPNVKPPAMKKGSV